MIDAPSLGYVIMGALLWRLFRALVAHFTTPRCVVCGTRQDRPANVCRNDVVIGFHHIWETR